jgi:hypothetical protein
VLATSAFVEVNAIKSVAGLTGSVVLSILIDCITKKRNTKNIPVFFIVNSFFILKNLNHKKAFVNYEGLKLQFNFITL